MKRLLLCLLILCLLPLGVWAEETQEVLFAEAAEALFWKCYKPLNLRKLKLHHVTEIDFVPKIGVIGKKVQE